MIGELLSKRRLVLQLSWTEFRGRYSGSVLGTLWAVLQPLTMIAMYTLIFAVVLKVKVGARGGVVDFGLFLVAGMIPFNSVADALRRCTTVYLDQAQLLRRIPMPPAVLPAARVTTVFLEMLIVLLLYVGVLVVAGSPPGPLAPAVLLLLPLQVMMGLGLGLAVASLTVLVRDIANLTESVLTIWFLATPVIYPRELLPPLLRAIVDANPMTPLVAAYRALLLQNQLPGAWDLTYLALVAGFLLLAGRWIYVQTRASIMDFV